MLCNLLGRAGRPLAVNRRQAIPLHCGALRAKALWDNSMFEQTDRCQSELFAAGSLRQLPSDDHICQTASNRDPGSAFNRGAVAAAMTQPWSNGQTEGQITKLKLVKRQMYGRAKLDLLRARLLQST